MELNSTNMKEDEDEEKGYIIIPRQILRNPKLTPNGRILLSALLALDGEQGCFASNAYLARTCHLNITTCSLLISKLKDLNYISVFYEYHSPKSSKIDKRNIHVLREQFNFKPNNKSKNENNFNNMLKKINDKSWRNL